MPESSANRPEIDGLVDAAIESVLIARCVSNGQEGFLRLGRQWFAFSAVVRLTTAGPRLVVSLFIIAEADEAKQFREDDPSRQSRQASMWANHKNKKVRKLMRSGEREVLPGPWFVKQGSSREFETCLRETLTAAWIAVQRTSPLVQRRARIARDERHLAACKQRWREPKQQPPLS